MAITTMDQYVDAKANRAQYFSSINTTANVIGAGGIYYSSWAMASFPGPGGVPPAGSGATVSKATPGAFPFSAPSGSNLLYLDHCSAVGSSASVSLFVADRLVHTSGLSGVLTSAQPVNTVALPARATGGVGVQIALEVYTNTGGNARTFTVSYTNTLGTPGRTVSVTGLMNGAGRMLMLPLAAGDLGVLSVESVTLDASTGTAGDFGVTLFKPIAPFPGGTGGGVASNASTFDTSVMRIDNDACLWSYMVGSTATSLLQFNHTIIEG